MFYYYFFLGAFCHWYAMLFQLYLISTRLFIVHVNQILEYYLSKTLSLDFDEAPLDKKLSQPYFLEINLHVHIIVIIQKLLSYM